MNLLASTQTMGVLDDVDAIGSWQLTTRVMSYVMFNSWLKEIVHLPMVFQKKLNQQQTMDAYSRTYGTLVNTFVNWFFL